MSVNEQLALDVRASDYDRFLCIQLAPASKRAALYALTAFNGELARIAETVSEPLIGHIRLAWWREALEEIIAGAVPRNHPVVRALASVYRASPAVFAWLLNMVEARAADMDESLLGDEAAWLSYLDATAGALHQAWAIMLDAPQAHAFAPQIAAEARGYAMIGLARAIPYMAQQGFLRFPPERIEKFRLNALNPSAELNAFVADLADDAARYLTPKKYPRPLLAMTALAQLAQLRLRSIRKAECDVYKIPSARLAAVLRLIQMKYFLC